MTALNRLDNEPHPEPPLFSAIITPHRSLSSTGFLLVMLLIGGTSFAAARSAALGEAKRGPTRAVIAQ